MTPRALAGAWALLGHGSFSPLPGPRRIGSRGFRAFDMWVESSGAGTGFCRRVNSTMRNEPHLRALAAAVERAKLYSTGARLLFHMEEVFAGVSLHGKRVLDIGGGSGLCSFYAAACGARAVTCLEPEAAGSQRGEMNSAFRELAALLDFAGTVELLPITLQQLECEPGAYEVLVLHDSINHLDEQACTRLRHDPEAREVYRRLFRKLAELTTPKGTLIAVDCSRHNFFPALGIRNPFAPQIEWQKHQSPALWAGLLLDCGFRNHRVRWSSVNRFGKTGRVLLGNRIAAFFLFGRFCLKMEAS